MFTVAAVDAIGDVWKSVQPDVPFRHWFLDEEVGRQYQDEERTTAIISYAAGLAIFVACLGLLGMTSLSVARRRKEIGVRKVFGSTFYMTLRASRANPVDSLRYE